jgi:hypothetical protein
MLRGFPGDPRVNPLGSRTVPVQACVVARSAGSSRRGAKAPPTHALEAAPEGSESPPVASAKPGDTACEGRALRPRSASGALAALRPLRDDDGEVVHVGVDENGLGPVLGPLLVTGVAFRTRGPRPSSLGSLVGDSKALVSHADVSLGEAWARALLGAIGPEPSSPAEIVERVSLDDARSLRAPCPEPARPVDAAHPAALCWPPPEADERFVADDALVERCRAVIRGWSAEGRVGGRFARRAPLALIGVRAAWICPSRLDDAARAGRHKFLVDLHEMERISLDLHEKGRGSADVPLDAVCGKVGGMDFYAPNFGPLSSRLCAIEHEGGLISAYRFPGLGRFSFLRDADDADPLVGLASLVGKYLRELGMARVVRYLRGAVAAGAGGELDAAALPAASGYRDPTTKRFILATASARAARGVPDRCFLRTR